MELAQSCPTLCDPMDCTGQNSPGQNTGVGSRSLLEGILPTEKGSNLGLPHYRQILYQLSHKGSLKKLKSSEDTIEKKNIQRYFLSGYYI